MYKMSVHKQIQANTFVPCKPEHIVVVSNANLYYNWEVIYWTVFFLSIYSYFLSMPADAFLGPEATSLTMSDRILHSKHSLSSSTHSSSTRLFPTAICHKEERTGNEGLHCGSTKYNTFSLYPESYTVTHRFLTLTWFRACSFDDCWPSCTNQIFISQLVVL